MTRYLILPFIQSALNRGTGVEQFLGGFMDGDEPALRWITLCHGPDGEVEIWLNEAYDQGDESFLDVYEFTPLDDDEDHEPVARVPTLAEALTLAQQRFGANPDRWVNAGVVQDEYLDHLRRQG